MPKNALLMAHTTCLAVKSTKNALRTAHTTSLVKTIQATNALRTAHIPSLAVKITKNALHGTHPFQSPKVHQKRSERIQKALADGTHPFLNYVGDNNPMKDPKVRQKNAEAQRNPSYEPAYQLFCALSETETLREIRKTLFDQFVGVSKSTIYEWVRKWHSEKNPNYKPSNRSPFYESAYQLFCALSKHLTVPEIRKTLYEQFPEVDKRTIRRWVQKWHSEVSHDSNCRTGTPVLAVLQYPLSPEIEAHDG